MRLACGEDNGVRLAGRTSKDTARIACKVLTRVSCGRRYGRLSTASWSLSTALVNTDRLLTA
jgi:hypothetical protein